MSKEKPTAIMSAPNDRLTNSSDFSQDNRPRVEINDLTSNTSRRRFSKLEQKIRELQARNNLIKPTLCPPPLHMDQDIPIDFSRKRQDSCSESSADDSRGSSTSPPRHARDVNYGGMTYGDMAYGALSDGQESQENDPLRRSTPSPENSHNRMIPGDSIMFGSHFPSLFPPLNSLRAYSGIPSSTIYNKGMYQNDFLHILKETQHKHVNRLLESYPNAALEMSLGFNGNLPLTHTLQKGMELSSLFTKSLNPDFLNSYHQQLLLVSRSNLNDQPEDAKRIPPRNKGPKPRPRNHQSIQPMKAELDTTPEHTLEEESSVAVLSSETSSHVSPDVPHVSSTSSPSLPTPKKRARSLLEGHKDAAYWERRRKNNDAAKRSRDARRAKEDEIAMRAVMLEQENVQLRVEVAALKTETGRLRSLLNSS